MNKEEIFNSISALSEPEAKQRLFDSTMNGYLLNSKIQDLKNKLNTAYEEAEQAQYRELQLQYLAHPGWTDSRHPDVQQMINDRFFFFTLF